MNDQLDPHIVEIANAVRRQLRKLNVDPVDAGEIALLLAAGYTLDAADGDVHLASDMLEQCARDVAADVRAKKITVVETEEPILQ